jgi:hypothetical protein
MFDDTLVDPVPRHRRLATAFAALSHLFVIGLVVALTSERPVALFINPPCSDLAITHVTFRPPPPPFPPGQSPDAAPHLVPINRPTSDAGDVKAEAVNDESETETTENLVSGYPLVVGGICGCVEGGVTGSLEFFQPAQIDAHGASRAAFHAGASGSRCTDSEQARRRQADISSVGTPPPDTGNRRPRRGHRRNRPRRRRSRLAVDRVARPCGDRCGSAMALYAGCPEWSRRPGGPDRHRDLRSLKRA